MLSARLVVAAIGLPLLALLIALPEPGFSAIVALLLAAAAIELVVAATGFQPRWLPISAGVASALIVLWSRQAGDGFLLSTLLLPALALYGLLRPGTGPRRPLEAWWLGVVAYVGVLGAYWVLLRGEPDGRSWIIVLLGVTFATDTGAYAVGRLIGRRPLAPRISPGKTWEGAVGGYVGGVVAGVALVVGLIGVTFGTLRFGVDPSPGSVDLGLLGLAAIALTLPIAAQAGDLLESALKRRIGVKDSSQLLPGHGGLLDRMDSQLLAGPLLYWLLQWL